MKSIVTVGGGTGTPVVNQALLLAGVKYINSIVTVMDSGGVTGRMRTDSKGEEVAYSDGLRTLLSLIDHLEKNNRRVLSLEQLLRKRNLRQQDLGYTIFSHFFDPKKGFTEIQHILESLTEIKFQGQVVPITLQSTNIKFETQSDQIFHGEHELDDKRMSADAVKNIWLDPKVNAFPDALNLIENADHIIFPCGSLHGSILVNFLPIGVTGALKKSKAQKILITNLASTRNETDSFTPVDYVNIFQKYSGLKKPIDTIIVPRISRQEFEKDFPKTAHRYALEHSHFLGWSKKELAKVEKLGLKVITHEATLIDPSLKRIRHDPTKLALCLSSLKLNS